VSDEVPPEVRDMIIGVGLATGGANVIMQLSRLPIGRGVALSEVHSGRVDEHPLKRLRTTTTFLAITMLGTEPERRWLRGEINRAHAQVRSAPGDDVPYNAFDRELQLWVAACLLWGAFDVYTRFNGGNPDPERTEVLYRYGQRLGTDLQVRPEQWPADFAAFQRYWDDGLAEIEMDDVTRAYLTTIADLAFLVAPLGPLGAPLRPLLRPVGRFMTLGFLPEPFRRELGLPWSERQQRAHDRVFHRLFRLAGRLPGPLRSFPINAYLWDAKRRFRTGRPVV
jgi:uncharacterized protein (DUF2236 family)